MKTSSCKAKGRSLQNFVAKALNEKYNTLDFRPAIMGEKGMDIKFPYYREFKFDWAIECKNQEKWNISEFWKQAVANTPEPNEPFKPLLVIKKNRHEPLVVLRFSDWLELI